MSFGTNIAPREEQNLLHNMIIQRCVIQRITPSGGRNDAEWPLGILRLHWALSVGSCVHVIILVCDISLQYTECKSRSHDFKITRATTPSELIPISTSLFFTPWYLQHILHLPSSCSSFSFFFPQTLFYHGCGPSATTVSRRWGNSLT